MTITREERRRLIHPPEVESGYPQYRFQRSPVLASLMGMLAALGMLTLITAVLTTAGWFVRFQYGVVVSEDGIQEVSLIGLSIAAIALVASTIIGGFVAGRIARYGGISVGIGSSIGVILVLAIFGGSATWLAGTSQAIDPNDLADSLAGVTTADLTTAAAIAAGGLLVLALLGGLLGGRFGATDEDYAAQRVVDLRDVKTDAL